MKFALFSSDELAELEDLWESIGRIDSKWYGCRPVRYSSVKIMESVVRDREFQAFIVVGGKGHGKSTYTIKSVAYYFMLNHGMKCGEAYQAAIERLAFTLDEVLDRVSRYDIVIWDDAGLFGSTYQWFDEQGRELLAALVDWYDVARTDISILWMSTPTKRKLPPIIRNDPEALIVRVRKHGIITRNGIKIKQSTAIGVRNIEGLYEDKVYREEVFRDTYLVYLPDPVYNLYEKIRRKYSEYARQRLASIYTKRVYNKLEHG